MKNFLFIIAFLGLMVACQELTFNSCPITEFSAQLESGDTKTTLSDSKIVWCSSDSVAIFRSTEFPSMFRVKAECEGSSDALLYLSKEGSKEGTPLGTNIAFYPYSEETSCKPGEDNTYIIEANIPQVQTFCPDSLVGSFFPMVAVTPSPEEKALQFKNVFGLLKLQLKGNIDVKSITLRGNNNEILAGKAKITCSNSETPTVEFLEEGTKKLSLILDKRVKLNGRTANFLLSLPPMTFSQGITIEVGTSYGTYTKVISKEISVNRSRIRPLAEIEFASEEIGNTVLSYTSSDGEISSPFKMYAYDSNGTELNFNNKYENGQGRIVFNGIVEEVSFTWKGDISSNTGQNLQSIDGISNRVYLKNGEYESVYEYSKWKSSYDFWSGTDVTEIDFSNFDISRLNTLNFIRYCKYLTTTDLSRHTILTSDMSGLFEGCESLKDLDLSTFNTSKVTNMAEMFSECSSLKKLDLSSFDTSKVTDMSGMFRGCKSLVEVNLIGINTSNVVKMEGMFSGCMSLKEADFSSFDTSNVTVMNLMFLASGFEHLDLSSFNTSKVTSMIRMFEGSSKLKSVNLSSFDTSNVTSMWGMFRLCESLENLNLSSFKTSNVWDMSCMFESCVHLKTLDVGSFDTSNVLIMDRMFYGCIFLKSLDISNFNTSEVTDMRWMFSYCNSLETLKLGEGFDTSNITNMEYLFSGCSMLKELDLHTFNTSQVTSMKGMFYECNSLVALNLNNFNTSNVTTMKWMFWKCNSLKELDLSGFNTSNVIDMYGMFGWCKALESLNVSGFNTSKVADMYGMFANCVSLKTLDISSFDTSKVKDTGLLFYDLPTLSLLKVGVNTNKAPLVESSIELLARDGVLSYPKGSDYYQWLSLLKGLGWKGEEY